MSITRDNQGFEVQISRSLSEMVGRKNNELRQFITSNNTKYYLKVQCDACQKVLNLNNQVTTHDCAFTQFQKEQ
ncbi:hypothetical protein D5018_02105 [Parashewanella curva]|uniref:Uncharacterized protein n=1 Tax=Parashewanella curva TaxID=2338552 RepID=A0A3L8Q3J7_9GAMM|nr:hypothetical protein [Parashewanella curva]RLV61292.1 hypothetical protein D5018_02105 [Parashewanella curva]